MSATRGNFNEVRDSGGEQGRGAAVSDNADRRRTAKASNDGVEVEDGGEDMLSHAGEAAE